MITPLTEYAGFWRRAIAFWVDILWISLLLIFLSYLVCGNVYCISVQNFEPETFLEPFKWQAILINDVLPAVLFIGFWLAEGATPGKLLLDCEIVDARTGKYINFKQALLRYIGYLISFLSLGLGFLWILWDKRKQGWHDKIAGTVVIIHDDATVPLSQLEKEFY